MEFVVPRRAVVVVMGPVVVRDVHVVVVMVVTVVVSVVGCGVGVFVGT